MELRSLESGSAVTLMKQRGSAGLGQTIRESRYCRPHVFVVDDEPTIAYSLAEILTDLGYVVARFCDPLEALAFVKQQPPDLLITDVQMPYMCGIDLAVAVTSIWPQCPVLFLSANLNPAHIDQTFGPTRRIRSRNKPCNLTVLIADVGELLATRDAVLAQSPFPKTAILGR